MEVGSENCYQEMVTQGFGDKIKQITLRAKCEFETDMEKECEIQKLSRLKKVVENAYNQEKVRSEELERLLADEQSTTLAFHAHLEEMSGTLAQHE